MASRSWTFVINNYTDADKKSVANLRDICTVVYASFEIGKENGTPHIQGYCTFKKNTTKKKAKNLISMRCHLDKSQGNKLQNHKYVFKEDSEVFINHDNGKPGRRTDLETACETALTSGLRGVAEEHPAVYVKFNRGLQSYITLMGPKRDPNNPPTVIWIYGETGTGKTKWVYDNFLSSDVYCAGSSGLKWFDGYAQQKCYLLDDFRSDDSYNSFSALLKLTDRYPCRVEVKGSSVEFNSPYIVITAPHEPRDEFPNMQYATDNILQLYRRITHIGKCTHNSNAETQILWTNSQSEATEAPWIDGSVQDSDSSISDASEVQD